MIALMPLDYALAAVAAILLLTGLIKGASGELGIIAGLAATIMGCCMAWPHVSVSMSRYSAYGSTAVGAIIVFWLVRSLVAKFLSVAIGQPMNALLGMMAGAVQCLALTAVLIGVGLVPAGSYSSTALVPYSIVLQRAAAFADENVAQQNTAQDNFSQEL